MVKPVGVKNLSFQQAWDALLHGAQVRCYFADRAYDGREYRILFLDEGVPGQLLQRNRPDGRWHTGSAIHGPQLFRGFWRVVDADPIDLREVVGLSAELRDALGDPRVSPLEGRTQAKERAP